MRSLPSRWRASPKYCQVYFLSTDTPVRVRNGRKWPIVAVKEVLNVAILNVPLALVVSTGRRNALPYEGKVEREQWESDTSG
jgi:hypothetical protein